MARKKTVVLGASGTENDELIKMAKEQGIEPFIGCTLVMLSTGQF